MPPLPLVVANAVNPALTVCLGLEPWVRPRPRDPAWRFWGRCCIGILAAVLLAEGGKRCQVWPGHPSFPSGHETFALAAATFLVRRDPRWLFAVVPALLLLAWALVAAHFHQPIDVFGALLVGPPVALLCDRLLTSRETS